MLFTHNLTKNLEKINLSFGARLEQFKLKTSEYYEMTSVTLLILSKLPNRYLEQVLITN